MWARCPLFAASFIAGRADAAAKGSWAMLSGMIVAGARSIYCPFPTATITRNGSAVERTLNSTRFRHMHPKRGVCQFPRHDRNYTNSLNQLNSHPYLKLVRSRASLAGTAAMIPSDFSRIRPAANQSAGPVADRGRLDHSKLLIHRFLCMCPINRVSLALRVGLVCKPRTNDR